MSDQSPLLPIDEEQIRQWIAEDRAKSEPCYNWLERTGFGDGTGSLSFNKTITAVLVGVFAYCALRKIEVSWALLSFGVILQGAGFGIKGYLAAVEQNKLEATLTASTAVALNANATIDGAAMIKAGAEAVRNAKLPNLWKDDESAEVKP